MIDAAVRLLLDQQNSDGGWGAVKGKASNTESTAFAVMALESTQRKDLPGRVQLGLNWLARHQNADGSWPEAEFTGTGFPGHFYINYHQYRNQFPLTALGRYRQWLTSSIPRA